MQGKTGPHPAGCASTAVRHRESAAFFLDMAATAPAEQSVQCVKASLIFSALTHEAFVDELAARLLDEAERVDFLAASHTQRLHLLLRAFWHLPDYAQRPYSTLIELFSVMNYMVAGMAETLVRDRVHIPRADNLADSGATDADWEAFCTLDNARRVYEDIQAIAGDIFRRAGIHVDEDDLFNPPVTPNHAAVASSAG